MVRYPELSCGKLNFLEFPLSLEYLRVTDSVEKISNPPTLNEITLKILTVQNRLSGSGSEDNSHGAV